MLIDNSIRLKDITIFEFAHTEECLTAQFVRIVCKVGTFHMFSFSNRPPSKILGFFKIATNISGLGILNGIELIASNILAKHRF